MNDRRRELLEGLLADLNKLSSFDRNCLIEVYVELSEVCQQVFDHKYEEIKSSTKAPRKGEVESMNSVGFKSISHS
jgi:hypothetical protein